MKLLIISVILAALYVVLLFSCSAVKKVNKDENKQLRVLENYSKKHSFKNDTVKLFIPGKMRIDSVFSSDTVTIPGIIVPANCPPVKQVTRRVTETRTIHDTFVSKIIDRSISDGLQQIILSRNADIEVKKQQLIEAKDSRDKWRLKFWILIVVSTLLLLLFLKFKFF